MKKNWYAPRLFGERLLVFIIIFTVASMYTKNGLLGGHWSIAAAILFAIEILAW